MQGYRVLLQSESLLEPKLALPEASPPPQATLIVKEDNEESKGEESKGEETESDEEKEKAEVKVVYRHKFRTHLLARSRSCFNNLQQVE